ncbi:MAG: hypothetical protein OQK98_03570 [Gammaproteobacteria bacterium]|nr:hypothetical protein [Gammaproteobacteria bacterium]
MSNIPLIQQNRIAASPRLRRANKVTSSEQPGEAAPKVQRRLERRKNQNRRKKQVSVRFDRRLQGNHRRNHLSIRQSAADNADLSDNVGRHINITA